MWKCLISASKNANGLLKYSTSRKNGKLKLISAKIFEDIKAAGEADEPQRFIK